MKNLLLAIIFLISGIGSFAQRQKEESYVSRFDRITIDYLIYLPKDYNSSSPQKYPVMVWHHGNGEKCWQCGKTTTAYATLTQQANGLTSYIEKGLDLPFIVVSPRSGFGGPSYPTVNGSGNIFNPHGWTNEIYDTICKRYPKADAENLLLGGLSEGGNGVFNYVAYPGARKLKAAIICSGWNPSDTTLRHIAANNIPIYDSRTESDKAGGYAKDVQSFYQKAIAKGMSKPKMTVYSGYSHDAGWVNMITNNNAATVAITWDPAASSTNKWQDWIMSKVSTVATIPEGPKDTVIPPPVPTNAFICDSLQATVFWSTKSLTGGYWQICNYTQNFAVDSIAYNWGANGPFGGRKDSVYAKVYGRCKVANSGNYTFSLFTDDGSNLWVNDKKVISDYTNHGVRERTATVTLAADTWFKIGIDYYEAGYDASLKAMVVGPNLPKQVIKRNK